MKQRATAYNIPVLELTRRCLKYGKISATGLFILIAYYIKLLIGMVLGFCQNLFYSRRISATKILKPPIFILGHYRSGTTYLHTLLSKDKRFGYLTNYDMVCANSSLLFGSWLKKTLQFIIKLFNMKTSFFNNKRPDLDEPAEEDRFLINKGLPYTDYWGFVFPLSKGALTECSKQLKKENYFPGWKKAYLHTLKLITYKNSGKQLVLKNPPNTERIKYLLKLFPDAKFVYIHRNPYHVFYSMRNLWIRAIKKYCLQKITDDQVEEIVFDLFEHMIDQYETDKFLIPAKNLFEVKYEQLEADPLLTMKEMYAALNLPAFDEISSDLKTHLTKDRNYKKFHYSFSEETFRHIEIRWSKYIKASAGSKSNSSNILLSNVLNP